MCHNKQQQPRCKQASESSQVNPLMTSAKVKSRPKIGEQGAPPIIGPRGGFQRSPIAPRQELPNAQPAF